MDFRSFLNSYIKPWTHQILSVCIICVVVIAIMNGMYWLASYSYGDVFSFGQFIMSVLLLPTVIVGFSIAIREFRRSQDIPILDLMWEIEPGKYDKTIKLDNGVNRNQGVRPVIVNSGKAVAVWYLIHFDIPLALLSDLGITDNNLKVNRWIGHVGDKANWRQDLLGDCLRIVFMSNGSVASYPYYPLALGIFHLSALKTENETRWYEVPYTIITDQGQHKNAVPLSITLRAPSDQ